MSLASPICSGIRVTHRGFRSAALGALTVAVLAFSTGCFLVPATTETGDGSNTGNGANNGDGSTDGGQNSNPVTGVAGPRGEIGPSGLDCWDLNGNGQGDEDEDMNGDGVFDAVDCQGQIGLRGRTGAAGQDGVDGRDGVDGMDGADGADGMDISNVLARGAIPSSGNLVAAAGGIMSAERTATGEYTVEVSLSDFPADLLPVTADELTVLITIEAQNQSGGTGLLALLFAYYDITAVTPDTATIDISIRDLTNTATNANFSVVVLAP